MLHFLVYSNFPLRASLADHLSLYFPGRRGSPRSHLWNPSWSFFKTLGSIQRADWAVDFVASHSWLASGPDRDRSSAPLCFVPQMYLSQREFFFFFWGCRAWPRDSEAHPGLCSKTFRPPFRSERLFDPPTFLKRPPFAAAFFPLFDPKAPLGKGYCRSPS